MSKQVMALRIPSVPDEIINRFGNTIPNSINLLASKIVQTSQLNEMRQALYKEAFNNNWNNQYFLILGSLTRLLVSAYLAYNDQYKMQTYNASLDIDNIIEQVVEFAATDILLSYPEFSYKITDSNIYQKADSIIKYILNEVNVASTKLSNYLNYIRGNITTMPNAPLSVPNNVNMNYNRVGLTQQQNQSMMLNNQTSSASRYTNNTRPVSHGNFITSNNTQGGYDRDQKFNKSLINNEPAKPILSHTSLSIEDWRSTSINPYLTLLTNDYTREFQISNGIVIEKIQKKGTSVDRRAHCLIGDVPVDTTTRVATANKLTDQHFGALREKDPVKRQEKINEFVDTGYLLVDTLESGIVGLKMQMLASDKANKKNDYHRYNLLVAKCYPDIYDYNNYMDELSSCSSFVTMANTLNMYIDQAKTLANKTGEDKARLMMFLSGINQHLTKFINNFLSTGLGIEVRIDSFVLDVPNLEEYLQTKYGSTYSGAYRDFEFTTSQSILKVSIDKDTLDSNFKDEELKKDININYIPKAYSVSFVNLFLSELGLEKMETKRPYAIMRDKSPMLYNIAASIYKDTTVPEGIQIMDATSHLVVTVDDIHIYLNKSYLGRDLFVATIEDK